MGPGKDAEAADWNNKRLIAGQGSSSLLHAAAACSLQPWPSQPPRPGGQIRRPAPPRCARCAPEAGASSVIIIFITSTSA
jgi:hypothetical protein